ncbi:uncharacterized protein LOC121807257 isoform X2 [Salvia splendens]|uniref:uncharacterized protein LOC121807257 isoform X2 n=1 Tax=Salvia splendens TaxID=180675 RepID=UPI001C26A009|nr:uncharacterized protein LOC121807257 isoform X2 [Salvia splendens]
MGENPLNGICCLLMASLFGLSTCFQFNDPDWYFWIPLYASACFVNLLKFCKPNSPRIRKLAKLGLCLGVFLFIKVGAEDLINGKCGIWCMNMRERVVRERLGSGLVVCSMFLVKDNSRYGLPILVGVAYGISFIFFAFQHHQMRY